MRVLLINVPHPAIGSRIPKEQLPPLGLLCIGGPLIDDGHHVELIDAEFGPMTLDPIVSAARAAAPDLVMFGHSGSSSGHPIISGTAQAIAAAIPSVRIVYGGVHPTYFHREILRDEPYVHAVVRGEGEETVRQLVRALEIGPSLAQDWLRKEKAAAEKEKSSLDWGDVVFEVDLLRSQEINLDYILELIFEHNKKTKSKADLVDEVRRVIRASLGNRAKESLVVDFINQTDLDHIGDKAGLIEVFFTFAQAEQRREAEELISSENLNAEAARRYIATSLRREFATENGTELNAVLPKMSPLNPQYLSKKQSVFQKIAAFVEKFKGVGGQV